MDNIQTILLTLQIIVAVILIILVLLQKSGNDSLGGIGGGPSSSVGSIISGRTAASALNKITAILIFIFILNCLILTAVSRNKNNSIKSKLDEVIKEQELKEKQQKIKAPSIE